MRRIAGLVVVLFLTIAAAWGIGETKTTHVDPGDGGYWSIENPEV